ncbi:hypothetical protein NKOR_06835 [Candidatus Nitrosopumilus koreensis AR1]|uniref:Uncharacterized protein n=1 Tax=Candidatus Nitrosopumilus koreensis AR1 TaxID=1229908 RepID=K0B8D2_9ARCH|nr:hypothetical protein NKOR_06835 [Candidatus Nitrosopumilus koreensis AR1]
MLIGVLGVLFTGTTFLIQNAHATTFTSIVANDPDDGDTIFSNDDTIIMSFASTNATGSGTMTDTEIKANFTSSNSDLFDTGGTYTGFWSSDSTTLTIYVNSTTGVTTTPVPDTTVINYDTSNGKLGESDNTELTGGAITLTGDFGIATSSSSSSDSSKNGSGCAGDCEEPTIGIDSHGKRQVSGGFSYNGYTVDVERYFTPYPLITADIGKTNVAEFKIYENTGVQNIRHFTFAFGMDKGDIISNSKAKIELDIDFDGTETVTVTDPENALDNIKVTTSKVSCMEHSTNECLKVSIQHMFRAPLDFNIVGTDVWDTKRSSWQNYYNHGIEVVGESLNPPKEYDGVNKGHIYHLTETSKTTAVDEFGDTWTFQYGTWSKDYIKKERIQDGQKMVFDRMHSEFGAYKKDNVDKAFGQLLELCPTCIEEFTDLEYAKSYDYAKASSNKLDRPDIKYKMIWEENKAQKIMNQIMDSKFHIKEAYFGNQ